MSSGSRRAGLRVLLMLAVVVGFGPVAVASGASWTALVPSAYSLDDLVTPIDLGTNTAGSAVATPAAFSHLGVAMSPDARTAYVVSAGSHALIPVDMTLSPPVVGAPIDLTGSPPPAHPQGTIYIAVSPDGTKAYVSDTGNGQVVPVDLTTTPATVQARIAVGGGPAGIAFSPNGAMAYVADATDGTVTPITVATGTPGPAIVGVGLNPNQIAITPDGHTAYVTDNGSANVYPIALPSGTVGSPIPLGSGVRPLGIAITPDGKTAFTANFGVASNNGGSGNTVTPIDIATGTAKLPITVGGGPWSIAATPDSKTVYVGNSNDATVTPIDVATGTPGMPIAGVRSPRSIAITPDQAPVASFTVTSAPPGSATTFDATPSTVRFGTIARYDWGFGDGTQLPDGGPHPSHVYATAGNYTATVTETDSAGTSTSGEVFTGQTASRVGNLSARTTRSVVITNAPTPAVSLSEVSLDFGTVGLGRPSSPQTVTLTNKGTGTLSITGSALAGLGAGAYSLDADGCTGASLAPTANCSATVRFAPSAPGSYPARLAFTDNASGSPHTISLTGSGATQGSLTGTVRNAGTPLAGVGITICLRDRQGQIGGTCQSTSSTASGSYGFGGLSPGSWAIQVNPSDPSLFGATVVLDIVAGPQTLDLTVSSRPKPARGITFLSPSHGTQTSATANPVLFWDEPNVVQIDRSLFPPNGTVVVTQVVLRGTNLFTGEPLVKTVNVGGTIAGNPIGLVFGNGPLSVSIPPLKPLHGQVSTDVVYHFYAGSMAPPSGISATQVLDEIYPDQRQASGTVAAQPTDPLPAFFTNFGYPGGMSIGPGSISGPDAQYFRVVPLASYGVPAGSTDCGATAATLQPFDNTSSTPPPSTECGVAVQFTPPPQPLAHRIYYSATLEVPARSGGLQLGSIPVTLNGCDSRIAGAAANVSGLGSCYGSVTPPDRPFDPNVNFNPNPDTNGGGEWIDPSGTVLARIHGSRLVPLPRATVTLRAGVKRTGRFIRVRSGSVVMSPGNRRNPDLSSPTGGFGWDVVPGFYRVTASKRGCRAVGGRGKQASTPLLTIPPAALDLSLRLSCPNLKRAVTRVRLSTRRGTGRFAGPSILAAILIRGAGGRRVVAGTVTFRRGRVKLAEVAVDPRTQTATLDLPRRPRVTGTISATYSGSGQLAGSAAHLRLR